MVKQPFITLAASAARTAAGNGDALDLTTISGLPDGEQRNLVVQSDVTAISGTSPTMTVIIEDSVDGGANWNTVATLTAQTTVSRQVARVNGTTTPFNPRKIRARWTVGGTTPNVTFSVKAVLL